MRKDLFVNVVANCLLVVVIASVLMVGFYGETISVFSKNEIKPIYRGNKDNANVTLMVNVYWGNDYIDGILQVLKDYEVKTTFFVGGYWVAKFPECFGKIVADGHEIANHGYNHKEQGKLDYQGIYDEIMSNHKIVQSFCGIDMNLFAPPSGSIGSDTVRVATENGYKVVMWSRDTVDWRDKDAQLIFTRATKNISNGELILMHPTKYTLEALPKILDYYRQNGFNVVPVSQNIK